MKKPNDIQFSDLSDEIELYDFTAAVLEYIIAGKIPANMVEVYNKDVH